MDKEDTPNRQIVAGSVKWFDPAKGFGFVVSEEGGPDILLHANVLRNFGQSSLADGAGIRLVVQETERGVQAFEVLEVIPPENPGGTGLSDIAEYDSAYLASLPLEPVRIKWFDKIKGFGFANVFGQEEDIFVHIEVLRQSGFTDLAVGEAVCLKVIEGKRGRMAAEVLAWDVALRRAQDGAV